MISNKDIQRFLKKQNLYDGNIDGILGPISNKAIDTSLYRFFGHHKEWNSERKYIAINQVILHFHSMNPGVVDGLMGPNTEYALERWQNYLRDVDIEESSPVKALKVPYQRNVRRVYGPVGQNQVLLNLPYKMQLAWDLNQTITRFSIHKSVAESAHRVLTNVLEYYKDEGIAEHGFDLFGGCLNVRPMRGGKRPSMHSWGVAIDFDPLRNRLRWGKDKAQLASKECEKFWEFWEEEGWVSLGRERNYDWMHVQAAKL